MAAGLGMDVPGRLGKEDAMLVLTVKQDTSVTIKTTDGTITIWNLRKRANGVRIGIEAPRACTVLREGVSVESTNETESKIPQGKSKPV